MEEIAEIEAGYQRLAKRIQQNHKKAESDAEMIRNNFGMLLSRMGKLSAPVVKKIGLNMLKMGKQDTKGELYDPQYHNRKMIVLGKTATVSARPDAPGKEVTDQFCLLGDDGNFYELMYSNDGFLVDSYLHRIETGAVMERYGYEALFMLYRAMKDYLDGQEKLLEALHYTLGFIFPENPG